LHATSHCTTRSARSSGRRGSSKRRLLGVGGEKLRLDVAEPGLQLTSEIAALAVGDEGSSAPKSFQPALEGGGDRGWLPTLRERFDAFAERVVLLGQAHEESRQRARLGLRQLRAEFIGSHVSLDPERPGRLAGL
jgi:hypothetical protein